MRNAWSVPVSGSEFGKYSFAKTSPVTVLYRKKSYHSRAGERTYWSFNAYPHEDTAIASATAVATRKSCLCAG